MEGLAMWKTIHEQAKLAGLEEDSDAHRQTVERLVAGETTDAFGSDPRLRYEIPAVKVEDWLDDQNTSSYIRLNFDVTELENWKAGLDKNSFRDFEDSKKNDYLLGMMTTLNLTRASIFKKPLSATNQRA